MPSAPTQAPGSPVQTTWTSTASTQKTTGSIATEVGDLVIAMVINEESTGTFTMSNTGTALSWTQRERPVTGGSNCSCWLWTAPAPTSQTITFTATTQANRAWGLIVWVWRAHGGLGDTIGAFAGASTAISTNATVAADSAFVAGIGDWSASSPAAGTAKYRTNIGAVGSEIVYQANVGPGLYSGFVWDHPDTGSGTLAVGSTSTMTPTIVGAEILGAPFPAIESQNPTADDDVGGAATSGSTSASSHSVVLPATVSANSLLMIIGRTTTTGTVAITGGGWTIYQESDASVGPDVIFWAVKNTLAAGTEGGTSVTVTHGTGKLAAQSLSITGAADPATLLPDYASATSAGEVTTMDAPSLAPDGGAENYLWIAAYTNEGANPALSKTPPANYTNDVDVRTGVAGNNWDNSQVKVCARQLNAASEDPGSVTLSVADNSMSFTIAVYPQGTMVFQDFNPDADLATTGWTTTPLFSKISDASDSTVISATLA